jgi:hypothetical protein
MQGPRGMQPWLFAALGAAVLVLLYSMTGTGRAPRVAREASKKHKARTASADTAVTLRAAAPADATFDRYRMIIARNVFSPPAPPKPAEGPKVSIPPIKPAQTVRPTPAASEAVTRPSGPPPPPPLTGWSYVGYVVIGGKKLGIVENDGANTTENVEIGASFHGYTVKSVDGEQIVLEARGSEQILKRPTDFGLVPLSGSASPQPSQRPRP